MSLNWMEIDLILNELRLENSSIQKIRQPDFHTLVLDLYIPKRRSSLLISLAQGKTRLHSISMPVKNQVSLQRFAQMLRARIQGGRISSVYQIEKERIIRIEIHRAGETTFLFLRLWGGAGNIIATDENYSILDAFYRRPKRGEVSGKHFNPQDLIQGAAGRKPARDRDFQPRSYPEGSSFNLYIEQEYRGLEEQEELARLELKVSSLVEKQKSFLEQKLEELGTENLSPQDSELYKQIGDILMANLFQIPPKTDRVQLPDFYHEGAQIEIQLEPALSPQQNAERYYKLHRKSRRKSERLSEEIRNLKESLLTFEKETEQLLGLSDPAEKIPALRTFIESYSPVRSGDQKKAVPGLRFSSGSYIIMVGRSAKENDAILRQYVRGNDYWLHTRDYPGGYVFIKYISGKSIPLDTLLDAGNLAMHYSKARTGGTAELYYTQVKYLRRAKDGKQGLVIPTHEKNLSIRRDEKRLERLLGRI